MRRRSGLIVVFAAIVGMVAGSPGAAAVSGSPGAGAGVVAGPQGGAVGSGSPGQGLEGYYRQQLDWQPCDGAFQCAMLDVPRDYARPTLGSYRLPVIRQSATDPAHRVGSLIYNPGGPAAPDVAIVASGQSGLSAALQARFDVVTWDRRGTATSDPTLRCQDGATMDAYLHLDPSPMARQGVSALLSGGARYTASCRALSSPGLVGQMGSVANARDMDILRAALGEPQVNYIGFSYGTYQGALYAGLFPDRIRTLALDGMFDPAVDSVRLTVEGAAATEREIHAYADGCAAALASGCPAATPAAIMALIERIGARVGATSLPAAGTTRTVGPAEFQAALTLMTVAPEAFWAPGSQALVQAGQGDGTGLLGLSDAWNNRLAGGGYNPATADSQTLWCTDRPWPTADMPGYTGLLSAALAAGPHAGGLRAKTGAPCGTWPATGYPHPVRAAGAPPILVVSTTGDPISAYQWGVAAAATFDKGVLLTWQGHGHTAYGRSNSCVADAVDNYLLNAVPPPNGMVC